VIDRKYERKSFVRILREACRYGRTQLQPIQKKSSLSVLVSVMLYPGRARKYVFVYIGMVLTRILLVRCTALLLYVLPILRNTYQRSLLSASLIFDSRISGVDFCILVNILFTSVPVYPHNFYVFLSLTFSHFPFHSFQPIFLLYIFSFLASFPFSRKKLRL
jgi:hypothetical protein